ncbi:hypothetical protein EYF80_038412 [Liparis tanakae]|uniref:Uncharacterized protein n=1 Tax=Liparis tanakae TaxID=230148 RepID=A0A4Z2GE09_9TELE|nr:hypothetical protein EYF80_038412 [Liparis tanakae]
MAGLGVAVGGAGRLWPPGHALKAWTSFSRRPRSSGGLAQVETPQAGTQTRQGARRHLETREAHVIQVQLLQGPPQRAEGLRPHPADGVPGQPQVSEVPRLAQRLRGHRLQPVGAQVERIEVRGPVQSPGRHVVDEVPGQVERPEALGSGQQVRLQPGDGVVLQVERQQAGDQREGRFGESREAVVLQVQVQVDQALHAAEGAALHLGDPAALQVQRHDPAGAGEAVGGDGVEAVPAEIEETRVGRETARNSGVAAVLARGVTQSRGHLTLLRGGGVGGGVTRLASSCSAFSMASWLWQRSSAGWAGPPHVPISFTLRRIDHSLEHREDREPW